MVFRSGAGLVALAVLPPIRLPKPPAEAGASSPRADRGGVTKAPPVTKTGGAFGVVRPWPT
ncbi:hypothetical protein ACFZCU_11750 [Streptomyces canus]|uniref:hypothetical protein n=1 Tax=Streptomyces canus TaxID=58343 RepID=UPI0036E92C29